MCFVGDDMRQKKTVSERVQKELPEFADTVAGLSVDELHGRLAELAKASEAVEEQKEQDEALETAKETQKELMSPYRDAKKAIRLKSRYIISLIKEKGGE